MARHAAIRALLLVAAVGGSVGNAFAQDVLSHDLVVEDVRYFLAALEEVHPDPYSALGGKVEFKRRSNEILYRIPTSGLSAREIYEHLAPLIADLGDGHTRLSPPAREQEDSPLSVLPVRFRVVMDATYISRAARGFEDLVGQRLMQVEGRPVDEVRAATRALFPAENEYGAAMALTGAIRSQRLVESLFGRQLEALRVELESPDGSTGVRELPFAAVNEWTWEEQPGGQFAVGDSTQAGPIRWRILEPSGVGYLRLKSIEGREAFVEARGRQDLPTYVGRYYSRYLDRDAPEDLESALIGIPCFTATVGDLLQEMRARDSEILIVDVRGNGGGWSSLMLPLYLLLFGSEYADYPFPDTWVDSASPRFLEMNDWDAGDLAREWGSGYQPGDYRFETLGPPRGDLDWREYAATLEPLGCGLAAIVDGLDGRPLHSAEVAVLTDTGTFSAAFHLAYTLWRLGASVVGTPSAQSGNAYTNVLRIELPNSRLTGSIARSAQIYFPDDEVAGEVLTPDFPVLWKDLARYGFDSDAEVAYALDLISSGRLTPGAPGE
jgi:hypothetical protein